MLVVLSCGDLSRPSPPYWTGAAAMVGFLTLIHEALAPAGDDDTRPGVRAGAGSGVPLGSNGQPHHCWWLDLQQPAEIVEYGCHAHRLPQYSGNIRIRQLQGVGVALVPKNWQQQARSPRTGTQSLRGRRPASASFVQLLHHQVTTYGAVDQELTTH